MRAQLASAGAFKEFKDRLTADPRLNVSVLTERQFYAEQSSTLITVLRTAGTILGLLMGVGAVFGAVNTMYSAVAARTSEIATLRAWCEAARTASCSRAPLFSAAVELAAIARGKRK